MRKKILAVALVIAVIASVLIGWTAFSSQKSDDAVVPVSHDLAVVDVIKLPDPVRKGNMSLEETFQQRRSVREYTDADISLSELSQLVWAAQGITSTQGFRTVPSAGALYPLEVYVVNVTGVYHYNPLNHTLGKIRSADVQEHLTKAALNQDAVRQAPLKLVIMGVNERAATKYGERAERYVHLEAGHAAQNVLLECTSLGLGAVPIGAFDDSMVREVLETSPDQQPLYIIPIGHVS
ncbi:MAG: SagB/ThcOx family dehydrogenase [Halobacteriota archaeon]